MEIQKEIEGLKATMDPSLRISVDTPIAEDSDGVKQILAYNSKDPFIHAQLLANENLPQ